MTDQTVSSVPQERAAEGLRTAMRLHHEQQLDRAVAGLQRSLEDARATPYEIEFETRVRLGLELADVLMERGELPAARQVLGDELAFAGGIVEWIGRIGDADQQRTARQGYSQLRDRAAQAALIGQPAPELTVREWVLGEPVTLADLIGRPVLLEFWATWCSPCVQAFQKLREIHETWRSSGVSVIALTRLYSSANGSPEAQQAEIETDRQFVEGRGLDLSVGVEEGREAHRLYGATGLPTLAVIDRGGLVVSVHRGVDDPRLPGMLRSLVDDL